MTTKSVNKTQEEFVDEPEMQLNDESHVWARNHLINVYRTSLVKKCAKMVNNPTIVDRLNHIRDLEKLWSGLFVIK